MDATEHEAAHRIVCRPEPRGHGWQACVDGDWTRWSRGSSRDEAIGACARVWADALGIAVSLGVRAPWECLRESGPGPVGGPMPTLYRDGEEVPRDR